MIIVSKNAQKHLTSLLSHEPIGTQIRVFVIHPGTQIAECGLAFCHENEIEKLDIKLKYKNFFIYVNQEIISYLKNAEIDLITDHISSQLTLKAPYVKKNCSLEKNSFYSKESSLEEKIQNFLNEEINPQLSMHGGQVHVTKIDKTGTVTIRFSGGCNGCSMIGLTLKQTVEKKLLSTFSVIKKVRDETEHLHGTHSFY
ncbi:NfuA family Fe-S biogenesis protein [Buchnera aphidicola (Macrosiphoniella sanborni)]|uniref:Fe/S biogenesis protein NfuA n=1 Tax=Buchnera aphidicola (Macrosiphoniella sanborni) TaxID=1241865 RepID=A0A4D6Y3A8_9GAMM|nr:NfuA family Fe-S biogenesis protein [Buchnera aphidicola]QCI24046.1 NfuA family Fe-S biogenesis protein [Buchnera aphidicola (Macrosiphoniella sanborni)]